MKPFFTNSSAHSLTPLLSRLMMVVSLMTCVSAIHAQKLTSQLPKKTLTKTVATSTNNTARLAASAQSSSQLAPLTTFNCADATSYLFQGRDGSGATTLDSDTKVYKLNITTGTSTLVHGALLTGSNTSINNVGFNVKDNYLWGYVRGTNKLVRIANDWSTQLFTISGLPTNIPFNAGDIDENGIMYLYYGKDHGSPSTIKRVNLVTQTLLSDLNLTSSRTINTMIDMAYNPVDHNLYGVDGDDDNGGFNNYQNHLYRINPSTGAATDLGNTGITYNQYPFGAAYFDNSGTLYISQNQTGHIYRIKNVSTGAHAADFLRKGPITNDNDGARCSNSPVNVTISGSVFNDTNSDNIINGSLISSLLGNTFYVNLVGSNGKVVAKTAVTNGQYSFTDLTPNVSYTLVLTNTPGTVGSNPPSTNLVNNVDNTGEHIGDGAGNDGNSDGKIFVPGDDEDTDDVNFGVRQLSTTPSDQPTFNCADATSYLFQGRDGAGATTTDSDTKVYRLDITTGASTLAHGQLLTGNNTSINNVGFNVKDNYLWGYVRGTNKLVRIGSDWSTQLFTISGLSDDVPFNSGDIDKDGIMYLYYGRDNGEPSTIKRVNLVTKTLMSDITLQLPNNADPGTIDFMIDMAINPVDNKLYGVSGSTSNDGDNSFENHLYRINPSTGAATDLGNTGITSNQYPFGAAYFDNNGTLYISQNHTGKIYKIKNVSTGAHAATFLKQGPVTNDNDGARCSNSPVLVSISGKVFDDANGLVDGIVNGTAVSALSGNTFYANLVGSDGKVITSTTLTSGMYTFNGLTPNVAYSVVLTNTAGTPGSNPPSTTLSNNVVNTGEFIGTGAGSDGTANGVIAVPADDENTDNVNFGVDKKPTANNITADSQPNPGGSVKVTVPTLTGSDLEDGTYTGTNSNTVIIQTVPSNATLYYDGSVVAAGKVISNYDPTKLLVDPTPASGPLSVSFTYSERDKAAKDSPAASVIMPFDGGLVTISGTVFDDGNGLTDGIVNGTAVSSLSGNTFYVSLVGPNGKVISSTTLTNGTYSFSGVTPNASYSVVLSNSAGTIGSNPPSTNLTGSVVNTGENIGTGAGSDGSVDGIISGLVTSSVSDANFGVDKRPTADPKTASSQPNPGGTTTVSVPTLTGSDLEDGTYTGTTNSNTIVITSLPTNATLIYNNTPVTSGQVIPNYDPTKLLVDPATGPVSVTFTYSERDKAGKDSESAKVTIPFTTAMLTISGTVFDDGNGLTDGIVNGTAVSSLSGNTFYVNLVGPDGKVITSTTLTSGTYSFPGLTANTSYSVVLTNSAGTPGATPPATTLTGSVVNTGEFVGTGAGSDGTPNGVLAVVLTTTSVSNANFGVDKRPTADPKTASSQPNPGGTTTVSVPTLTGSDLEDGTYTGTTNSNTIVITSLPTNATLIYNNTPVTSGQVIPNYDPTKLLVDPATGPVSVTFTYSERDKAGKDSDPAKVTMSFLVPDLTPIIYARPGTVYGTTGITVVVDVVELLGVTTNGLVTVRVTKDALTSLTFDPNATSIGDRDVKNSNWTQIDKTNTTYYIFTTTQPVPAGDVLTFGMSGTITPGASTGTLTISTVIDGYSGGEVKITNNVDAEKIDYFQQ